MRAFTSTLFAALLASVANAQSSGNAAASPVAGAPAGSSAGNAGASPAGPGTVPSPSASNAGVGGPGQGSATPSASSAGGTGVAPSASSTSAGGISSTPGVGGATPSSSSAPGGAGVGGVGNSTTTSGNGTATGYPYLNGTAAVNYLLQSLNLSTGCQNTVKTLTSNATAEGQCLHTGVVWAAVNQNSSLLPYLDQWLEESCSSAPCSNATLTGALDQVLGNCSDDFNSHNITAEDVAHWFQVYPLAREIACLKTSEPFNGTLPNITSNTTWQNAGGVPSSSALGGAGAGTGASATPSASSASSGSGSAVSSASGTQQAGTQSQDDPNSPENSGDNNWGPYGGNSGEDGSNSGAQGDQNSQGAQPSGATPSGATGNSFVVAADNNGAQGGDQNTQGAGAGSDTGNTGSSDNTGAQGAENSQGVSSAVGGAPTSSAVGGAQSGAQSAQSRVSSTVGNAATPTSSAGSTGAGAGGVGGTTAQGNSTLGNSTTSANSTGNSSYCLTSLAKELSAYMGSNLTFPYLEILILGGNETAQQKLAEIPPEALCQECVFAAFDLIEQSSPFLADMVVNKKTNQTLVGWLNATCANATEKWQPSTNGTLPEGITATTFNSTYGFNVTYFNETTGNWTTKAPQNVTVPIGQGSKYLNETDSGGSEENGSDSGSSGTGVSAGNSATPTGSASGASGASATPSGSASTDPAISSASASPAASSSGSGEDTGAEGDQNTQGAGNQNDNNNNSGDGGNTGAQGEQNTQSALPVKRAGRFAAHQLRAEE